MISVEDYQPGHGSALEQEFALQLSAAGIPFEREYRAIPGRRFRYDFAITEYNGQKVCILIEIQGGIWQKGGHTSGVGVMRDQSKVNLAQLHGYKIFQFNYNDIHTGAAIQMIKEVIHDPKSINDLQGL